MLNYPNDQPTQGTVINETAKYNLLEAARWGKFLAVVGFATMGLMILCYPGGYLLLPCVRVIKIFKLNQKGIAGK